MRLWLDLETYNEVDIAVGTYKYAETAEILLVAYAIDDGPVCVWDRTEDERSPVDFERAYESADEVIAHNAQFDRTILTTAERWFDEREVNIPVTPPLERWRCTMAQALSHALPASLSELCLVLRVPEDKSKLAEGKKLVRLFTQPQPSNRKVRRATRHTHPEEWKRFKLYAANDIEAMRESHRLMPSWNWSASAIAEWHLDQKVNSRGFFVDRELTQAGAIAAVVEKERIGTRFRELTGGTVDRPSQRAQFMNFLNARFALDIDNTRSDTFKQLLKQDGVPAQCRELMQLSIASNKTSTAKYAKLDPSICNDGRFRGATQFAGAGRTRRDAGRGPQFQNLPSRGLPSAESVEDYIDALKRGMHDLFFDDLMLYGAAALRGTVIAPPDKKLIVADLSNIEGRMLAWLANERWKLQAFRDYDKGIGPDLYNITAVSIIGGDPWNVGKANRNTFGKVPDLACIAEGQLVDTDFGLVPIENVTTEMRVWDGTEFVAHEGVVARGFKETIEYQGLVATIDHRVFVEGREEAIDFGEAVRTNTPLVKSHSDICKISLRTQEGPGLSQLWRAGSDVRVLFGDGCVPLGDAQHRAASDEEASTRSDSQQRGLQTRQPPLGYPRREQPEQTHQHPLDFVGDRCEELALLGEPSAAPFARGNDARADIRGREVGSDGKTQELARYRGKARVFDIINAGPRHRFTVSGCVVHNCGYRGGVTGFQTFARAYNVRMADHWGTILENIAPKFIEKAKENLEKWGYPQLEQLEISELEWIASETCKLAWRARHPATCQLWYDLQDSVVSAIRCWGETFKAGLYLQARCVTHMGQRWLLIRLPSGRFLTYFEPNIERDGTITYWGEAAEEGSTIRAWVKCYTHGGKLTGNACQTLARDQLFATIPEAERQGYPLILKVHDEDITETPDTDEYTAAGLSAIIATNQSWNKGLPLAAAGFEAYRYKKE